MLWEDNYLAHYGITGQKWGIRRYQNKDGTLTEAGKKRYGEGLEKKEKKMEKEGASKSKQGIFSRIKKNTEEMIYPPEMRGKSKEEKKAWEEAEKKKFKEQTAKDQKEIDFASKIEKFDKLSSQEKQKVGGQILEYVTDYDKNWEGKSHDEIKKADGLRDWLFQRIDNESGNWNTGDSVSAGHKKTLEEMHEVSNSISDYEKEFKKKINYKELPYDPVLDSDRYLAISMIRDSQRKKEFKRFQEALKKDNDYMALVKQWEGKADKLCGVVLKDLGFPDTPEYRSMIYPYVIYT